MDRPGNRPPPRPVTRHGPEYAPAFEAPVQIPHHGQETDHTCGPAALRMILDALWGIRVEEESLAKRLGTDAHIGTRQRVLARFVGELGLEAVVHHTDTDVSEIGRLMDEGHVVVVCYWLDAEDTDHYAVVSRIDGHRIVLQDPWTGPETELSLEVFDAAWRCDNTVANRRDRWLLAVRVPPQPTQEESESVTISLVDVGAMVHLDRLDRLLGHPALPVDLVGGAPGGRFGPFTAPLSASFEQDDVRLEVRLHAVGVLAVRATRPAGAPAWDMEQRVLAWREQVRAEADAAGALYETYSVPPVVEQWEVRVVHERAGDLTWARTFVFGDATAGTDADLLRRDGETVLVGRDRAVVWCAPGAGGDVLDVLELARAELLEFRTYDAYLDRRLDGSFRALDRLWAAGGLFRSARAALRELAQVRVEVARLTDPLHGTGKAFGDRFTERLHARVQERMRIGAWEHAVAHKTEVLEDMFHLAQEETNHRRGILLEVMIVVLFILDLALLLRVE